MMEPALGNRDIEYEEPQGELEEAIAQVWKEAFKLEKIGRNDNFFWLGGNSLLGMDLSEMLTTRLALEISVLTIFQYPSIREVASLIQLSR
jgi:Phosphopantetheine attachment site